MEIYFYSTIEFSINLTKDKLTLDRQNLKIVTIFN